MYKNLKDKQKTPKSQKSRPFNFSAGPATLPDSVVEQIGQDLRDWHNGISVMELSHRIPQIIEMTEQARNDLRELLHIPQNFKILFMQGGARSQFSAIPLNLLGENLDKKTASYLLTGHWSKLAMIEAQKYAQVCAFSDINQPIDGPNVAYIHCTDNETIDGVELPFLPNCSAPLVLDASSSIMSKAIDFKNIGIVYAATQKNLGIAGLTIVIVREDLIGKAHPLTPSLLDYDIFAKSDSMANTPPVFCWYITGLMLKWVQSQGGVSAVEKQVLEKSKLMYDLIDQSDFYQNKVPPLYRSKINIPFNLPTAELEQSFLKEAQEQGLLYLKGHKVLGGIRASLYNAMPIEGAMALSAFMKEFMEKHRG